jgi:hypothetical protein
MLPVVLHTPVVYNFGSQLLSPSLTLALFIGLLPNCVFEQYVEYFHRSVVFMWAAFHVVIHGTLLRKRLG